VQDAEPLGEEPHLPDEIEERALNVAACAAMRINSRLQRVPASLIQRVVRARAPQWGHRNSAISFVSILVGCSLIA
jgi:hypothetical protein